MNRTRLFSLFLPFAVYAQGTLADYQRAGMLRARYQAAALNIPETPSWLDKGGFWYRKSVAGGHEFVMVDASTGAKAPAFDHEKLAASLSKAANASYTAVTLPFNTISFADHDQAIEVAAAEFKWKCSLSDYTCQKQGPAPAGFGRRGGGAPPQNRGLQTPPEDRPVASPDEKWEALIQNFNVYLRPKGKPEGSMLSFDGSEANHYAGGSISWSPDSKKLAVYRVRPGYHRKLQYVESSPPDQLQPKSMTIEYAKPGDLLDLQQPVLFLIDDKKQIVVDSSLFPNPYQLSRAVWWKDSRAFTFEYNQRGHQVYRVIEVDAASGKPRALISEESNAFVDYRPLIANPRDTGKRVRYELHDGKEIIWGSERDGWEHLYLYDGVTGKLKSQITKGNWVVRAIERVDEEKRQIWFQA